MELADGVIRLSPLTLNDVEPHLAGEDAELVRWLSGGISTRQTVEDYIRRCMTQWDTGGPVYAFGIRVGRGSLAGTIEVQFGQSYLEPGAVNLSYGLYPVWRGRGIAARAVLLAGSYAAKLGASQAVTRVEPGNLPSAAVARRAGYTQLPGSGASRGLQETWFVKDLEGGGTPAFTGEPPLPA